jgi:Gram-negative bacterial TonB protein C-terminal
MTMQATQPARVMKRPLPYIAPDLSPSRFRMPLGGLLTSWALHVAIVICIATLYGPKLSVATWAELTHEPQVRVLHPRLIYYREITLPAGRRSPAIPASRTEVAAKMDVESAPNALTYRAAQPIISQSDHPDNAVQTIRQPDAIDPPKIPFPVRVPTQVMLAGHPSPENPRLAVPPSPPDAPLSRSAQAPQIADALKPPLSAADEEFEIRHPVRVAKEPLDLAAPKVKITDQRMLQKLNVPVAAVTPSLAPQPRFDVRRPAHAARDAAELSAPKVKTSENDSLRKLTIPVATSTPTLVQEPTFDVRHPVRIAKESPDVRAPHVKVSDQHAVQQVAGSVSAPTPNLALEPAPMALRHGKHSLRPTDEPAAPPHVPGAHKMPNLAATAGPPARLDGPPRASSAKSAPNASDSGGTAARNLVVATAVDIQGAHERVPDGEESGNFNVVGNDTARSHSAGKTPSKSDNASVQIVQGDGRLIADAKSSGSSSTSSPFSDISIVGGGGGRSARDSITVEGKRKYESYGLTIIGTGSSGGGLRDFGVFHDQTVYTVYIPMVDSDEAGADWTLQYATDPNSLRAASQGMLLPPIALEKHGIAAHDPRWLSHPAGTAVVRALINSDGKFQDVHVLQTPDTRLNDAIAEVLGRWLFRPAELNGEKVPVIVLLGIPFAAAH